MRISGNRPTSPTPDRKAAEEKEKEGTFAKVFEEQHESRRAKRRSEEGARDRDLSRSNSEAVQTDPGQGSRIDAREAVTPASPGSEDAVTEKQIQELVREMRVGLDARGREVVELELNSETLEGLKIRLTMRQGKLQAEFLTRSLGIARMLTGHTDALKQGLAAQGITLTRLQIRTSGEETFREDSSEGEEGQAEDGDSQDRGKGFQGS